MARAAEPLHRWWRRGNFSDYLDMLMEPEIRTAAAPKSPRLGDDGAPRGARAWVAGRSVAEGCTVEVRLGVLRPPHASLSPP